MYVVRAWLQAVPTAHKFSEQVHGSCTIFPIKSIVPVKRSRNTNTNGRSTRMIGSGWYEISEVPTVVTAAASVPSSSTATNVFCFTKSMKMYIANRCVAGIDLGHRGTHKLKCVAHLVVSLRRCSVHRHADCKRRTQRRDEHVRIAWSTIHFIPKCK